MARPFKGENLPNPELPPIGPSGIDVNTLEQTAEPMSIAKIEEVINAFARAAADAKRLGFDGVELHGAHGYLIDQFFWKETNRRTDEYGRRPGRPDPFCQPHHPCRPQGSGQPVPHHLPLLPMENGPL